MRKKNVKAMKEKTENKQGERMAKRQCFKLWKCIKHESEKLKKKKIKHGGRKRN